MTETAEVAIVGSGPAGLSAAIALAGRSAGRIVVLERETQAGGIPRHCAHPGFGLRDLHRNLSGPAYAARLTERALAAGVEVRTATQATGWAPDGTLALTGPGGRTALAAGAVILATGCRERPRSARLIPGTRPAGVITTGTLQQLVHLHGRRGEALGTRALVVGAEHVSYSALETLERAGVPVVGMITEHPHHQTLAAFALGAALRYRVTLRTRTRLVEIHGRERVEAVTLARLPDDRAETLPCDLVVLTADWIPDHELAVLAGAALDDATRGPSVDALGRTTVPGVFAGGNLLRGAETADRVAREGAGLASAVAAHLDGAPWPAARVAIRCARPLHWTTPNALTAPGPQAGRGVQPALGPVIVRARELVRDARIEVRQGDRVLHRERMARVMPGRSARIGGAWLADVDPRGPVVRVRIERGRPLRVHRR